MIMQDFVHLHVHTQYSILDGQASIPRLVDKAMADGMKGIAVTDHGDMFGGHIDHIIFDPGNHRRTKWK
jgi:DNA polymerase III alpha subunit